MIRKLVLLSMLLSISSDALAISITSGVDANNDASGTVLTSSSFDSTGYEYIVVIGKHEEGTVGMTFEDNKSSTFSELTYAINGADVGIQVAWAPIGTPGTGHTVTVTLAAAREFRSLKVYLIDSAGTVFLDEEASATGSGTTPDAGSLANDFPGVSVMGVGHFNSANWTESSGWTQDSSDGINRYWASRADGSATTVDPSVTASVDTTWAAVAASFYEVTSEYDQEGFSFGDDDGNEATHTLDTQDTNVTEELGVKTLRTLVNLTGTGSSITPSLYYQKNGTGGYVEISTNSATPGLAGAIESTDVTASGSNTTSQSLTISHPAYVSGDLLIAVINLWTTGNTLSWGTLPNSETMVDVVNSTSSTQADGPALVIAYWLGTGTEIAGSFAATSSDANTRWTGGVIKVPAGEFLSSNPISAAAGTATAETGSPNSGAFTANSTDNNGRLVVAVAVDQDPISGTPTGYTDVLDVDEGRASLVISARDALVTTSESIGSVGWTIATDSWITYSFIVRPPADVTNDVYISASANVTAGGEATTARLSAPAGKTTGDFDTGRRWDDENGSDAVAIGDDEYTEYEWVLTTQSPATTDDYLDFRTYVAGNPLDTYTVTPRWTIGTGGGEPAVGGDRRSPINVIFSD